jgi:transcriptional regulator GlxA family with amidase domain
VKRQALTAHVALLQSRLDELAEAIRRGDGQFWADYHETARTLAALLPHAGRIAENPERLLTTAELANASNLSTRTVERMRKRGQIRPANVIGKAARWAPDTLTMAPQSTRRR